MRENEALRVYIRLLSNARVMTMVGVLALLTVAIYLPSLRNGFFILDDGLLIYENNALREISWSTLRTIFTSYDPELYIPLTLFSYQLDYLIGGYNPVIYHITNLLLHTCNVLLVTWLVELLSRRTWLAFITGALFAVHPLHTEAVVWAAARKDLLSSFFFLASFIAYLRSREQAPKRINESMNQRINRAYVASLLLFIIGLLSKATILTLPIVLLLLEWLFIPPSSPLTTHHSPLTAHNSQLPAPRSPLPTLLPFFLLSILFGIIALGGKQQLLTTTTILEKALLACKTTVFFVTKLLFPVELTVSYPQLSPIHITSPEFLIPVILLAVLLSSILLLALHPHLQHIIPLSPEACRQTVFWILFSLITLAPSFAVTDKGKSVYVFSDRYGYLPSIGIFTVAVMLFLHWLQRSSRARMSARRPSDACLPTRQGWAGSLYEAPAKVGALGTVLIVLSFLTLRQSLLWGDWVAFLEKATQYSPHFYRTYIDLGASYRVAKRYEDAIGAYRKALSLFELPNIYGLVGQVYAEQGNFEQAVSEFQKGISLHPDEAELHYGLGQVYALMGKYDAALAEYERALALMPEDATAYQRLSRRIAPRRDRAFFRMGLLFGDQGDHARAVDYLKKALQENPYFADAHYNLGVALGNLGKKGGAIPHYEETVRLEPKHVKARVNLGLLYFDKGLLNDAERAWMEALKIDPTNAVAKRGLIHLQQLR